MSIWDRLRRAGEGRASEKNPAVQREGLLSEIEIIPGKLSAKVSIHSLSIGPSETLSCWTYVTNGLLAYGQKEIVFTLRRDRSEKIQAFPDEPLNLFSTIYHFAQNGQIVDAGGVTQFSSKTFLGRHLIYIDPHPIEGVTLPKEAITALLLTEEEVVAAQEFGIARLMARLGRQSSYYPCPCWSDRSRPGLSFLSTKQNSILSKVQCAYGGKIRVLKEGETIHVSIPPTAVECIREMSELPPDTSVAIFTSYNPHANACLVWEPGQNGAEAITPPNSEGSRLSGCFLLLVPGQEQDRAQVFEDGFVLWLTDLSKKTLLASLLQGNGMEIPGKEGWLSCTFEWLEKTYYNPFEKAEYVSPAGWERYRPETSRSPDFFQAARLMETVLLSTEKEFAENVKVEEVAAFAQEVEKQVQRICNTANISFELLIQCTLNSSVPPAIRIDSRGQNVEGEREQDLLKNLYEALGGIQPLYTNHNSVTFHMRFSVSATMEV